MKEQCTFKFCKSFDTVEITDKIDSKYFHKDRGDRAFKCNNCRSEFFKLRRVRV